LRKEVSHGIKALGFDRQNKPSIMPTAAPPSRDAALEARVFWWRFRKEIAAVIIIAALSVTFFGAYRFYTNRRASAAASLLADAKSVPDYERLIERYPKTPAAASAYLLLAEKQRDAKKFVEANAALRAFIDKNPNHELAATAEIAIAANLESMGKNDEALSTYEHVAASHPQNFNAPLALVSAVSLLKAKNRTDEARRICERVITDYRDSFWAGEAARQLRLLKPSATSEPPTARSTIPPLLMAPSAAPAAPPNPAPIPNKPHD
jgi:predicted negative regulator of RcsB-dependent stress response